MLKSATAATAADLFQAAHRHHVQALAELEQGQLRAAAASAWDAVLAATNGLLLARTGREPADLRETDRLLWAFVRDNPSQRPFETHYGALQGFLHEICGEDCFCGMEDSVIADVRESLDYIRHAEKLAGE